MNDILYFTIVAFIVLLTLMCVFIIGWATGFNDALHEMKNKYQQAVNIARGVPPELKDLTPLQWAKNRPAEIAKKQGYDASGRKIVHKEWSIY